MPRKAVICPERIRKVPARFSWVDHRLVRDHHLDRCEADALALYLFLITVADAQGLSYYSEAVLARRLSMDSARLRKARHDLIRTTLIAYQKPLYQVLDLTPPTEKHKPTPGIRREELAQLCERLRKIP
jgi:hypothetical protein